MTKEEEEIRLLKIQLEIAKKALTHIATHTKEEADRWIYPLALVEMPKFARKALIQIAKLKAP